MKNKPSTKLKRIEKICLGCENLLPASEDVIAECLVDEDVDDTKFCENYVRDRGRSRDCN
jgi:SOS response regulatory protein OraA/RecX